jgi:hypothetical protein
MNLKNNLFAIAALVVSLSTASPLARADASSQKNESQPNIESKRQTTRQAMSSSISALLTRNLNDVFGENDPARRRAAIEEIFTEDCVFYDPTGGVYRGRDPIDQIAGKIRAMHSDFSISADWRARGIRRCRTGPMPRGRTRKGASYRRD